MTVLFRTFGLLSLVGVAACSQPGEDVGFDSKKLSSMQASVWVDPFGCEHWVIDDGVEGYLSSRLNRDGTPRCSGSNQVAAASIPQSEIPATLWTDPKGCQHWVYDDGGEGYMSQRLSADGRPVCPGVTAPPSETETITLAADALFDTDKSDLRPEAINELNDFGAKMQRLGKKRVLIVGHTDSRASDAYNQSLSERRAASVAAYLEANFGIISQTEGRGESQPVESNDTVEGRQANRRVEISLLD
ncbi:MAG: OmpA family protein [Pseudomonadota bacterium]